MSMEHMKAGVFSRMCRHLRLQACVNTFWSNRSLARLLSVFLCCLVVVIRPASRLGGQWAFLVLALKELVFSVQENLAQQLELTILNVSGALLGIGTSTLVKYISSLLPEDSAKSRAICAVFLVANSFLAGLIKSRLIRLQMSMRISMFISIWLLTSNIGMRSHVLSDSGAFLWISLAPAILSLVSLLIVMAIMRLPSPTFEKELARAFSLLQTCLSMNLQHLNPANSVLEVAIDKEEYLQRRSQLLKVSIGLNDTYSQAAFELRVAKLGLKSTRPFISIVEHLRRELCWGLPIESDYRSSPRMSSPIRRQSQHLTDIEGAAVSLGNAVAAALKAVEHVILAAFHQGASRRLWSGAELQSLVLIEEMLKEARDDARERLARRFDEADLYHTHTGGETSKELFHDSLVMISLLQMAQEMRLALTEAQKVAHEYDKSGLRLWYPRLTLAWLGIPPSFMVSEELGNGRIQPPGFSEPDADVDHDVNEEQITAAESQQGFAEHGYTVDVRRRALMRTYSGLPSVFRAKTMRVEHWYSKSFWWSILYSWWSHRHVVRMRLWVHHAHRSIRHSSHLRHAMKSAVGVALLSSPAFLPENSSGRKWFTTWHGQWMVISYLWVLETNTGATWRIGYLRLFGTALGALYAYITYIICKDNPFGLVILITAFDLLSTWLITKTSLTPLAVPASVTLPTIVLAKYVNADQAMNMIELAAVRVLMISAGILAALLMNSLVFPRHCRVLFLSDASHTLGSLSSLYMTLSHDVFHTHVHAPEERKRTLRLELYIRNSLHRLLALIATMRVELSLLPKPLQHYGQVVTALQKLLDLMTGLRKIRQNIPRRQTVANVFKERREFMSCVCITLFACQHAFKTREPLPQFLPSARHALTVLQGHIGESLQRAREDDPHTMGLSLVYAFAEQEVMENMVDALEELLELTGRLFGTSAWLTFNPGMMSPSETQEGEHGWYSTYKWEEA